MTNILFLVWDACRADYAKDHAATLQELGDDNMVFENAVAPSTWSLPSHASLFSGLPPHEHGITSGTEPFVDAPVLEQLGEHGYRRYGVSANGFTANNYVSDEIFDEFQYTLTGMEPEGLDAYWHSNKVENSGTSNSSLNKLRKLSVVCAKALTHENPVASFRNVARWVYYSQVNKYLNRLEILSENHPIFTSTKLFQYTSSWNTGRIETILKQEASNDDPFFLFSNYMDTHHPYYPAEEYQRTKLGRALPFHEVKRLNDQLMDPVTFIANAHEGEIDEADLEMVRDLYAGEVAGVDDALETILALLSKYDLQDDTLVVVTADHGENLGEEDAYGRRRMGHIDSVSDNGLRVPLVVAHPALNGERVDEWASITSLGALFEAVARGENVSNDLIKESLVSPDGVVVERPADHSERWAAHSIPTAVSERESFQHTCIGYVGEWKYVADTTGHERAWKAGNEQEVETVPTSLREQVQQRLDRLLEMDPLDGNKQNDHELDPSVRKELENLGYL